MINYKLTAISNFTMDNKQMRLLIQKNRCFIDTFKLTYERESYADFWLASKSFEYNQLVEEIRTQYKDLFKNINRIQTEEDDYRDDFLEEKLTPELYNLLYGRSQSQDNVLESQARHEV